MFRQAAGSLHRSRSPLGDLLHRMKAKLGPEAGITVAVHKIAIIFCTLVAKQVEYDHSAQAETDRQRQQRFEQKIERQAWQLGYPPVPIQQPA